MTTDIRRRATAGLAIGAAVLALIGNGLSPRMSGDDVPVYHQVANSTRFTVAAAIVLVALMLVTAAFVALGRPGTAGLIEPIRHGAVAAALVGGTIALAQAALQLSAYRQQAKAFDGANSHNVVSAFWATNAIDHVSAALFALWTLVLLGVAPMLLGVAQMRERVAARLGIAAIGGGAICLMVGIADLLVADQSSFDVPFAVGSAVVTLWLLATGVLMLRRPQATVLDVGPTATAAPTRSAY